MAEKFVTEPIVLDKTYREGNDKLVAILNNITKAEEKANEATQKADAASDSATSAAQSYTNANAVATQLTEYLATKETLTAPAVDKTLLIEGAAADAKVVGELKDDLSELYYQTVNKRCDVSINGYLTSTGNFNTDSNAKRTDYLPVYKYTKCYVDTMITTDGYGLAFFDSSKNLLPSESFLGTVKGYKSIPNNVSYCMVSSHGHPESYIVFENDDSIENTVESLKSLPDDIYELQYDINKILYYDCKFDIKQYVKKDGEFVNDSNARRTNYIDVTEFDKIVYTDRINNTACALAFFDSSNAFLSEVSVLGKDGSGKEFTVNIPSSATYVIFSKYGDNPTYCKLIKESSIEYRVDKLEKETPSFINKSAFGSFAKFGIIGDSLSVGHTTNPEDGSHSPRHIYYSWGQYLARRYGNVCLNFGQSGITAKGWLTHQKCYQEFVKGENLCQCYIVGLGANDAENLSVVPIGTVSDIGTDNNTFYAYYSKVLQTVNTYAPNSIIFALTLTHPRNVVVQGAPLVNDAIRNICNSGIYSNVHLIDLSIDKYNELFKDKRVTDCLTNGHFTALGYSLIADINAFIFSDYMYEHISDFNNIPFIPYGNNDVIN